MGVEIYTNQSEEPDKSNYIIGAIVFMTNSKTWKETEERILILNCLLLLARYA